MQRRSPLLAVFLLTSITIAAQVRYRPTETGPWRPWSFTATAGARQSRGAAAADVQAFQTRLQELAAIAKRAPGVTPPIGFAGELWGSLLDAANPAPGQPAPRTLPLAGILSFGAFPLVEFERAGKMVNEDMKGGETELLQFVVNQLDASAYGTSKPQGWSGVDIDAFVEPEAGTPVAGLSRVGDVFVVKKNTKPLWVPFGLADALQPIAAGRRSIFENRRDQYAKAVAEFAEWKTPAKRAARRADWQKSAASMPNGAAFIASMEKSDQEIEAANTTRLAPGGSEDRDVRAAEAELKEVDTILSPLSSDARRAASCYDQRATRLADQFRAAAGAPASCRPLVRPNGDYFDPKLPRSAPQVVMVSMYARCLRRESLDSKLRGGCVINRALVDSMDWNAVRDWLDR
jgi:hypothetical protein